MAKWRNFGLFVLEPLPSEEVEPILKKLKKNLIWKFSLKYDTLIHETDCRFGFQDFALKSCRKFMREYIEKWIYI